MREEAVRMDRGVLGPIELLDDSLTSAARSERCALPQMVLL